MNEETLQDIIEEVKLFPKEYKEYPFVKPNETAIKYCLSFLETLSNENLVPNPTIYPDGSIALEWQEKPLGIFVICFDEKGVIHYAGHFENSESIKGNMDVDSENISKLHICIERFKKPC